MTGCFYPQMCYCNTVPVHIVFANGPFTNTTLLFMHEKSPYVPFTKDILGLCKWVKPLCTQIFQHRTQHQTPVAMPLVELESCMKGHSLHCTFEQYCIRTYFTWTDSTILGHPFKVVTKEKTPSDQPSQNNFTTSWGIRLKHRVSRSTGLQRK